MDSLPGYFLQHFDSSIADMSFIGPDCLDCVPTRTLSMCESRSQQKIASFFAMHPVLAHHQLLVRRRVVPRALLFATQILGSDELLTSEQLADKSAVHLLMSVQMTAQWLLDDTLDVDSNIDGKVASQIVDYYLELLAPEHEQRIDQHSLQEACSRNGMPESFLEALTLLVKWQHALAVTAGIALDPASMYCRVNARFLCSASQVHSTFNSPENYLQHRAANCGLGLAIMCGARWFCRLWGVDCPGLDHYQKDYDVMIHAHSVIGGLSNDLFGYDKDVEEGVATAIEVVKQSMVPRRADEQETVLAFMLLIDLHNTKLAELIEKCRTCEDPPARAILVASLSTTWAVRVLHHEFMMIYQPNWLRKVLAQSSSAPNRTPECSTGRPVLVSPAACPT